MARRFGRKDTAAEALTRRGRATTPPAPAADVASSHHSCACAHTAAGRPNTWEHRARVGLCTLRHELDATCGSRRESDCVDGVVPGRLRHGAACLLTRADNLLAEAVRQGFVRMLFHGGPWRGPVSRLRSWWNGELYEGTFGCLHRAEVLLVALSDPRRARTKAESVLAMARATSRDDPRYRRVEELLRSETRSRADPCLPAATAELLQAVRDVEEERMVRIRNFRNRLVRGALLLTALLGTAVAIAFSTPGALPVCTSDENCLTDSMAGGLEVGMVMLLGTLGGLLSAAPGMQRMAGSWNVYSLPLYQEIVKLPVGALTAVTGLLFVGTDWFPFLKMPENWRDVALYAVAFGVTQLAFTRSIDKRAAKLLAAEPDREEAKQLETVPHDFS